MNNRILKILISGFITITFLSTGLVYASAPQQETLPDQPEQGWGAGTPGYCINQEDQRRCPQRSWDDGFHPMMSQLIEALANVSNLTIDEIESRLTEGERLFEIALEAGLSQESFFELHQQIREQFWQEWDRGEDRPVPRFGWLGRMFGRFFNQDNPDWPNRGRKYPGFGGCHR